MPGESQKEPITGQADPSVLTTEALQREVDRLEREQKERQNALDRETRVRAETRAIEIHALRRKIASGRKAERRLFEAKLAVLYEKFAGQDRVLALMEAQRRERKEDDRTSLDAAFASAEKMRIADTLASDRANTKTEVSTAEQLRQQQTNYSSANATTVAQLNTLSTRVERIENLKQGGNDERQDSRGNSQQMWLVLAGLVGIGGLFMTMLALGLAVYVATR